MRTLPRATSAPGSRTRRSSPLRSTRGQVFVETAIALLVFLFAIFSVLEVGVLIWTYLTLEHAVTEATRFATTQQTIGALNRSDSIKAKMREQAPGITIADGEFSFFNVTNGGTDAGGPLDVIRITVAHPYSPLFPMPYVRGSVLTVSSTMRNEPAAGAPAP
jgi:Flp pilus assembly protein TadG